MVLLSSGRRKGDVLGWERGSPAALFLTDFLSPTPHAERAWETILYEINNFFLPCSWAPLCFLGDEPLIGMGVYPSAFIWCR